MMLAQPAQVPIQLLHALLVRLDALAFEPFVELQAGLRVSIPVFGFFFFLMEVGVE